MDSPSPGEPTYQVHAVDETGVLGPAVQARAFLPGPGRLDAEVVHGRTVRLSWEHPPGPLPVGWELERLGPGGEEETFHLGEGEAGGHEDPDLVSGAYTYGLHPVHEAGAAGCIVSARVELPPVPPPDDLTAEVLETEEGLAVSLCWEWEAGAPPDLDSYILYRDEVPIAPHLGWETSCHLDHPP